ncbi:MAG: caspase family protein [Gammaproteobacteria bacterium]|nr:caspase family protein [Gammaproteobacteria bacterium]
MVLLSFLLINPAYSETYKNGQRTALVIGNSAYKDTPLTNPRNDAEDIANTLTTLGFDVIKVLDGDFKSMNKAVSNFGSTLEKKGGVGLFFYAGHGIQSAGRNYLIPVDSNIERETELKYSAIDAGRIMDEMGYANNGLNIAILDACRNNPLTRSFRSAKKGLARINNLPTGLLIAYSTAPGKQAADGTGRNSPYTSSLLESLKEKNTPLEMVFKNVIKRVKNETKGAQIPWVSSSVDGDFYFNEDKNNIVTPSKISKPLASRGVQIINVKPSTMDKKFEILYWESVTKNPTKEKLQSYIKQYPSGHFYELAMSELKRLAAENLPVQTKNNTDNQQVTSEYIEIINELLEEKQFEKANYYLAKLEKTGADISKYSHYRTQIANLQNETKKVILLSEEDQQIFDEYLDILKDLVISNNKLSKQQTTKAAFYIGKLEKLNSNDPKLIKIKEKFSSIK